MCTLYVCTYYMDSLFGSFCMWIIRDNFVTCGKKRRGDFDKCLLYPYNYVCFVIHNHMSCVTSVQLLLYREIFSYKNNPQHPESPCCCPPDLHPIYNHIPIQSIIIVSYVYTRNIEKTVQCFCSQYALGNITHKQLYRSSKYFVYNVSHPYRGKHTNLPT